MAQDKIPKPFTSVLTSNTIEELITYRFLRETDVVQLNGFYAKGDGADHKRIISPIDDGSGILLANGLYFQFQPSTTSEYIASLNTPYHVLKMQQEGILDEYYQYLDDKNAYDQERRELETQRQLAFENRENKNQTYEEWLSTQPMMLPVIQEPQPSEALLKFKEKYLG